MFKSRQNSSHLDSLQQIKNGNDAEKKNFTGSQKNELMNFVFDFANLLQLFSAEELQQKVLEEKINQTFLLHPVLKQNEVVVALVVAQR